MNMVTPNDISDLSRVPDGLTDELITSPNAVTADPTASDTPAISSVWLEQGDYFFDDEFSVPFDTNLRDNLTSKPENTDMPPNMTCSLGPELLPGRNLMQADQSRSDSCIFTPGDSSESGLASGQTDRTQSQDEADGVNQNESHLNVQASDATQCTLTMAPDRPVIPKPNVPFKVSQMVRQSFPQDSPKEDVGDTSSENCSNLQTGKSTMENDHSFRDGFTPRSMNGSQISGQSESTSWMQMLMERSCNPDLKALLNRTAAAVDYKLAYGDPLQTDSVASSIMRQLIRENSDNSLKIKPHTIGRSLSQGSLLTAVSLAGLRHALEQATQFLPDTKESIEPVQVRSVGVTAELNANDKVAPTSNASEISTSNTTTWAQRHGSRESLKRKTSTTNSYNNRVVATFPSPVTDSEQAVSDLASPWRAIKKASGTLITWNQLKRTINGGRSVRRTSTNHECYGDHTSRFVACSLSENVGSPVEAVAPSSTGSPASKPSPRSRSQPVSANHFSHRFSGTLLEIFMRAKAEEMAFGHSSDNSAAAASADAAFDRKPTEACSPTNHILPSTDQPNVPVITRRSLGAGSASPKLKSEASKHPLLRGNRILPHKLNPSDFSSSGANSASMHSFGAQFPPCVSSEQVPIPPNQDFGTFGSPPPPRGSQYESPIWSPGLPSRRFSGVRTYTGNRDGHPRIQSVAEGRESAPQSLVPNVPPVGRSFQPSPIDPRFSPYTTISPAACLTASAGPDSPSLAALRADCVADGYAAGWIGNPRASIAYPGLGLLSVPRPSRLTGAAFLSHTLPDLSFLTQAGAEEERKGTPTMPKRLAACRCRNKPGTEFYCTKCGNRSVSVGRTSAKYFHEHGYTASRSRRPQIKKNTFVSDTGADNNQVMVPDLVVGHTFSAQQRGCSSSDGRSKNRAGFRSNLEEAQYARICQIERSTSEPDLNQATLTMESQSGSDPTTDGSSRKTNTLMISSNQDWGSRKCSDPTYFDPDSRPKKSVSFSGNIRLHLKGAAEKHLEARSPASPEPRIIPRNWGLYGQETPLAEFNPRCSPGRDVSQPGGGEMAQQSDVDIRYHAMVNDVIKAVQETVAYYSTATGSNNGTKLTSNEPLPYSAVAALGSSGRQPLLAVISPLTVLLCDGLLPPNKAIFMTKPRTRLWQMVEESCRPDYKECQQPETIMSTYIHDKLQGACSSGVAFHVLSDAVTQVKALTNVTMEKAKFKAFICACLNSKALPMWLNGVVSNDALLRRYYCGDSFIRQCRSSQRGLHADLMTHLEQLLAFPFNLDLAAEARKPLVDPHTIVRVSSAATVAPSVQSMSACQSQQPSCAATQGTRTTSRPNIPPAVLMGRKPQPVNVGGQSSVRARFSPPLSNHTGANIHHYPQHHLPGQRVTAGVRLTGSSRSVRPNASLASEDSGDASSASSEVTQSEAKFCFKRATGSAHGLSVANTNSSQGRGRFKSALSTFRRTACPPTSPVKTEQATRNLSSNAHDSKPTASGIPTIEPQLKRTDINRSKPVPLVPDRNKNASKLKQPTTHVTRR